MMKLKSDHSQIQAIAKFGIILFIAIQIYGNPFILLEASKVPAVFMFGDSYGDTGNNDFIPLTLGKSNFPPYGRDFKNQIATGRTSNGKLMSDQFVESLGVKDLLPPYLDPKLKSQDLLTGVCFGSTGTGLDNLTAQILNVIPFWKQVENFKDYRRKIQGLVGAKNATAIVQNAITFITIGTNDFIINYYLKPVRPLQFTVQQYTNYLLDTYVDYIKELYSLNVRRIGLINIPPLGCLPIERTLHFLRSRGACDQAINNAASGYNSGLKNRINGLKSALPGLKIVILDYNGLISQAIANPKKYGFDNVEKGCCGTGNYEVGFLCNKFSPLCPDDSKYLFFDSIHLNEKAYKMFSNVFLNREIKQLL